MNESVAVSTAGEPQAGAGDTGDTVEQLVEFTGSPGEFLISLLRMQCRMISADAGAIGRATSEQTVETLAIWPTVARGQSPPDWLNHAQHVMANVARTGRSTVRPVRSATDLYGQAPEAHLIVLPANPESGAPWAAAFIVRARSQAALDERRQRLVLTMSLLSLYEARQALDQRTRALEQLQQSGRVLAALNEHNRAKAALMALCNELAAVTDADRVSIGFLRGRYVKVAAISHTENFTRKLQLVQAIESAMEESLDQDLEVVHPAPVDAPYVSRAAEQLSSQFGPASICSLPLRRDGEPVAVVTLERPADRPWTNGEVEFLRLTSELCTARAVERYETDRWIGARVAGAVRKGLAKALGPEHTWIKAAAVGIFAAILFFTFAQGPDYIDSSFRIEASERRIVPAPFDGYLDRVHVEPQDRVEAGQTVLAELERSELKLQLAPLKYERVEYLKQAATALRDGKNAEAQIAQAKADSLQARIDVIEHRIDQTRITCPIDGVVLRGELKQQQGAPVSKGDVLFEVAPLANLRAELMVPEDRIGDLQVGDTGELATAASPGEYLPFVVERINPMAEVKDERNVFRVRVRLEQRTAGLFPGVEGAARVKVGREHYAWLWTRDLIHWVRMKLWI
jgi:multidrug resistance efflux pump